ncbi:MAG: pyridoxal phosphate-dependent decarboxylase family protein [Gemmatimonadaceae bacterium]
MSVRQEPAAGGEGDQPPPVSADEPPVGATGDLSPELLVTYGRQLVEWIADYLASAEQYPVLSRVKPGDVAAALPTSPPATGEPLSEIIADFERAIVPGLTHWNHPGFFAYFANSAPVPGILAELLAAALNVNAMLWRTSPAATELELRATDWLRQMMGLAADWQGHINDTASISTMLALAAAREAARLDVRERGMAGRSDLPALRVYCSEQAHSSVDKGAITLGIGHENVVHVPVDEQFRMRPDVLRARIVEDIARGMHPLAVVATVGTTSTTSIDPVREIEEVLRELWPGAEQESAQNPTHPTRDVGAAGAVGAARAPGSVRPWLHIDAAYGGSAAVVPSMRHVLDGAELADSLVVNPHKWLFTPVDCSVLYVKKPEVLTRAFSLVPEYLTSRQHSDAVNLMDYGVQLGRRFRALKLWMVIRAFGAEGLASRIEAHCTLAREFAGWVRAERGWEVMAPVPFSTVCYRYAPNGTSEIERERINAAILERVNASGKAFISHTKLNGAYALRLAIGNIRTERRHVEEAWNVLRAAAR